MNALKVKLFYLHPCTWILTKVKKRTKKKRKSFFFSKSFIRKKKSEVLNGQDGSCLFKLFFFKSHQKRLLSSNQILLTLLDFELAVFKSELECTANVPKSVQRCTHSILIEGNVTVFQKSLPYSQVTR